MSSENQSGEEGFSGSVTKNRTDSLLNEFVNEHKETFLVNSSSFSHVQIFAIRMSANEH